ncbi:unnamed protein product [Rotaria sp. Silwood1]|nr:unnamed protein product [Rotaria sp. Silwood1]
MNTNMEHTNVQLIDLPNEVLLMIFKKLNNVELLYSLMGINTQLDRIISDSVFTKNLTLVRYFSSDLIYPLIDKILDRFCSQILPHIHSKINTLYLESLSMERILRVADYPNLHSLGLYNIDDKTAERVFSVLQRMPNLEKLALYICVHQETFLDGNCLKKDIVSHLLQLHNFIFNIRSLIYTHHQTRLLLNKDIEHTLVDLGNNQVICYVDYFSKDESAQCHFYSCPYTLRYYHNITNSFQGGLFKCVCEVSLFDERPFEHEFFI